jgi:hypothetical protein
MKGLHPFFLFGVGFGKKGLPMDQYFFLACEQMPKASFELNTNTQLFMGAAAVAAAALVRYYHYQQYETVEFGHHTKGWWQWVVGESKETLDESKRMN